MMKKIYRLQVLFIAVYFGEPALMLLLHGVSSTQHQLAFFVIGSALWQLFPPTVYMAGAIGGAVLLMAVLALSPASAAVYPLSYVVFGLAISAVLAAATATWLEDHQR